MWAESFFSNSSSQSIKTRAKKNCTNTLGQKMKKLESVGKFLLQNTKQFEPFGRFSSITYLINFLYVAISKTNDSSILKNYVSIHFMITSVVAKILCHGWTHKASTDGNEEAWRHGCFGIDVLVNQCLMLQFHPLEGRERPLYPFYQFLHCIICVSFVPS